MTANWYKEYLAKSNSILDISIEQIEYYQNHLKNMKVVILAGGLGTRLSELTKTIPKPMVKINGKPIIVYIMEQFAKYGHKDFLYSSWIQRKCN